MQTYTPSACPPLLSSFTQIWATKAKKGMIEMAPLKDEGFIVPTQVSYVGKGGILFEEGEK